MITQWLCLGTAKHSVSQKIFKIISSTLAYLTPTLLSSILMIFLIFGIPLPGSPQQNVSPAVAKAIAEAELNATASTNNLTWFALGCAGGPLSMTASLFRTAPPASLLLGKSPGYIDQYTKAYKAKTRSLRLKYATMGCLGGITISGLLFYFRYDISDWLYWNL